MNEKIREIQRCLTADAALVTSAIHRRYLTGADIEDGYLLIPHTKPAVYITDFRYIETARAQLQDIEVIEQESDIYRQVKHLMETKYGDAMWIESKSMSVYAAEKWREKMGRVAVLFVDKLSEKLEQMRMVKSPEEIEKIRRAQKIAEDALSDIRDRIRPGVSEKDIQLALDFAMMRRGSEGVSFETIVLTGAAASMPHGVPSAKRIVQDGDYVLLDFGAVYGGYHSDMTRTIPVGHVSAHQQEIYDIVLRAQKAALSVARAGITGKALDKAARDVIVQAGYGDAFGHALGHGVGMEIHEGPTAGVRSETVLQDGNVVTIEPGIYLPGDIGVRIEDFVVIREDGCENLTHCEK